MRESMSAEWCLVCTRSVRSKNRITPPEKVRDIVSGEHALDGKCLWWNYDPDTGFGLISNSRDPDLPDFGRSSIEYDSVVVLDSGLVDAAFEDLSENDEIVFLGEEEMLNGDQKHIYVLHEDQLYELLDNPPGIPES
jgi:hypothetical protein